MLGADAGRVVRRALGAVVAGTVALVGAVAGPPARAQDVPELPSEPEDLLDLLIEAFGAVPDEVPDPLTLTDPLNPACDPLDPAVCLFPFPSDHWTEASGETATGRRVALPIEAMPRNVLGKPVDPAEWNRNDGFSPGAMLLTHVPGLDLAATWGLADRPERYQDQLTDLALSLAPDAPIVLVDADTGARHPFFSELDEHPGTVPDARTLIIRPAVNLAEGHRYVVGLRHLRAADGSELGAGAAFAELRAGTAGGGRQAHYDEAVFPVLEAAGVDRDELHLAWDLTVASAESLTGRALHLRDTAFAELGDTDLDDGVVAGAPPAFTIGEVEERTDPEDRTLRVVHGTLAVPNFLTLPDDVTVEVPEVGGFPLPGSRFLYEDPIAPGPTDLPTVNPADPVRDVPFVCAVPRTVLDGEPAVPTLYGHGLLGSRTEALGGSTEPLRANGHMPCAVDWTGMSTGDVPNVALILTDISNFTSLADRAQQGFLDFLLLGRALTHPDGLAAQAAFQDGTGAPLFDPSALVYDGNSQGGIMGGALAALGVDFRRAVLGVPGMGYSTLLNRSVDWEGAYGEVAYAAYPRKADQQVMFALLQMLWDRGEANGYAHHVTADPLPDTPAKQVLLQAAYADHQVTNVAAEVQARTYGATRIPTDLPVCRHWSVDPMFGFDANDPDAQTRSVLAYFDSGTPRSPTSNTAPVAHGEDPHSDPRRDPSAVAQKLLFYETGRVIDPNDGAHARTDRWPDRAGDQLAEVEADLAGNCLEALSAPPAAGPSAPAVPADPPGRTPTAAPTSVTGRLPATGSNIPVVTLLGLAGVGLVGLGMLRRRAVG
ncbi:MAG: LPXTG cell wall anchor domain-containing protein [Actinomycetota bacterium]